MIGAGQARGFYGTDAPVHELPDRRDQPLSLQHAHNPVNWYPWGPEVFEIAGRHDKPIFLSIGYSTCHWCHVMERESFEDEEISRLLKPGFRLDQGGPGTGGRLDDTYMRAVH